MPDKYLKYPNGGFVMGSYAHMHRFADFTLFKMTHHSPNASQNRRKRYKVTDQTCLFMYASKHPERVVFDDSGQIMLNMFLLDPTKILGYNNYTVVNKWTDRQVCLMHFSGPWKLEEKEVSMSPSDGSKSQQVNGVQVLESFDTATQVAK
jgi:hypothetical protein